MQKTNLDRFDRHQDKLFGIYRGVVEERVDPLRLGRIQVRIWGVHTEEQAGDYNKAPWDTLQWAHPLLPIFEGGISGSGMFSVPLRGSHVFLFFENGNLMQPRYFASAPGFPIDGAKYSQLEKQDGFKDPKDEFPLTTHIKDHDWHRLSRVMRLGETYLPLKEGRIDKGVPYAFGGAWDEQPPMYEAEYPDNTVIATHEDWDRNMVIEIDATKGKNRLAWWHPSESYFEINKEGRMVTHNVFHRWDICEGIVHTHFWLHHFKTVSDALVMLVEGTEWREVKGDRWTEIKGINWLKVGGNNYKDIGGAEVNAIAGYCDTAITGNSNTSVGGNLDLVIAGNMRKAITGGYSRKVDGSVILVTAGDRSESVAGTWSSKSTGGYFVCSGSAISITADSQVVVNAGGKLTLKGASVEVSGPTVIGGATNINGTLNVDGACTLGGYVNLGGGSPVTPAPDGAASCAAPAPSAPAPPATPPANPSPPSPDIPPPYPPPEIKVEMPEPGC